MPLIYINVIPHPKRRPCDKKKTNKEQEFKEKKEILANYNT